MALRDVQTVSVVIHRRILCESISQNTRLDRLILSSDNTPTPLTHSLTIDEQVSCLNYCFFLREQSIQYNQRERRL